MVLVSLTSLLATAWGIYVLRYRWGHLKGLLVSFVGSVIVQLSLIYIFILPFFRSSGDWNMVSFCCSMLQACLLPPPRGTSCGNYARCVNQILQGLNNMQVLLMWPYYMLFHVFCLWLYSSPVLMVHLMQKLWLRVPLEKVEVADDGTMDENFDHLVSYIYSFQAV